MKKQLILITLSVLFLVYGCYAQKLSKELQDFAQDLSSANVKLRGELILFGKYKDNLSTLNYTTYLKALKKAEKKSNKGISEAVSKSEDHYFISNSHSFIIVLYCKKYNAIICDYANTALIDSIKVLKVTEKIPDLKSFVK